jgi:hypothetical protein
VIIKEASIGSSPLILEGPVKTNDLDQVSNETQLMCTYRKHGWGAVTPTWLNFSRALLTASLHPRLILSREASDQVGTSNTLLLMYRVRMTFEGHMV